MVVTGPCSIHDPISALEYAEKLQQLQSKVADQIFSGHACLYRKTTHNNWLERFFI